MQKDILDLEKCEEVIKMNYEALKTAFENNHFSQIAQRQRYYRSYIESLEILNMQGTNCREMVNSKLKHIKSMECNLDKLKSRIIDKIKEDKKIMNAIQEHENIQ